MEKPFGSVAHKHAKLHAGKLNNSLVSVLQFNLYHHHHKHRHIPPQVDPVLQSTICSWSKCSLICILA